MNKTLIAIAFLSLILATLAGNVVLAIAAPEQLPAFNGSAVTILGTGTAALVTIYGLGKQGQQLEQIKSQTNGTLTKAYAERDAYAEENVRLRVELAATGAASDVQGRHEG